MVVRFANAGGLRDFLAFLATVRGDLSSITAPPFILAPQSLVEFPAYWAERPRLFTAPALEADPARRLLCVLKLYLASLQRQYYVGRTVKEGLKKPLNPFLGELFLGEWKDESGSGARTRVVSEQVSHHPPTTACYVEEERFGVRAQAYSTQSTTLSGASVLIKQTGQATLTVDRYGETYLIPLPDVRVRGILSGVPYPELQGTYRIASSSGYTAEMRFHGSSGTGNLLFWSSPRNTFTATVYRSGDDLKRPIYILTGSWSDRFTIHDASDQLLDTFDLADPKNRPAPMVARPVCDQDPWESRRAWSATLDALHRGDAAAVVGEKGKLENAQREMRRREKIEGRRWQAAFFVRVDDDDGELEEGEVGRLMRQMGHNSDRRRLRGENGCWRYDSEKARRWKVGRRGTLTPFG